VRRPAAPDEARARALQISHNDLLAAAFLEALAQLQRARGAPTRRLGLWLPMNVRVAPFEGFGNGTSRLRLYRDAAGLPEDAPFSARAQALSAQRQDAIEDGEWAVPAALPGPAWARPLVQPALRAYLARPWVDMGSAPFSHAGRLGPPGRLASLVPGAVVMNLHPWHPVGMAGLTHDGETHLTLTWDAAQLAEEDVDLLAEAFDARLEA
jgi:hypothetical protein